MSAHARTSNRTHRILSLLLPLCIVSQALPAAAQTRRAPMGQTAAAQPKKAANCSGAWTGVVNYTRTQSATNNKTVPRVSGRGEDTTEWQMKYDYKAAVAVDESPEKNGTGAGRASINHNFKPTETVTAKRRDSCERGQATQVMAGEKKRVGRGK